MRFEKSVVVWKPMRSKKNPPCPGNPEDYVLIKTKEGVFWRRKRGSIKPVSLNHGFQIAVEATKIVAPAAKRIITALQPYLSGLHTGRLNIRISNALRRSLKETKGLKLSYLKGIEVQAEHALEQMLYAYKAGVDDKGVYIEIPIDKGVVKAQNRLATHYYFEALLVYGDVNKEKGLRIKDVESPLYPINSKTKAICVLSLPLPAKGDWMAVLKLSCLEGNELAAHPKHYRMKVVEVGTQ